MLKLGVIGAGIMGERMLRAATEHAADLVEISGVWDSAPAAVERVAAIPGVRRAESRQAVIDGADCVYVATPPLAHLDYARQALEAGRAAFIEKPLAVDLGPAQRFARTYGGHRAAVNFPMASSFAVQKLRDWIEEGAVGAPRSIEIEVAFAQWPRAWQQGAARWLADPAEGGFTREVVSHFLFLSRRLLGPVTLLGAHVERDAHGMEQSIDARIEAGGVKGRIRGTVGQTDRDDTNSWTLRGAGAIRLRDWSIAERERPDGSWVPDPEAMPNERARPLVLRRQLEQVVCMTQGKPHRLARLYEALEVQSVVETLLRGH